MSTSAEEPPREETSLWRVFAACLVASLLRYHLMTSDYQTIVSNHVEVSTPLNSWKRVSEGLYLQSKGIDPYSGDLLHEAPLSLFVYRFLLNVFRDNVHLMMIAVDLATSLLLFCVGMRYVDDLYEEEAVQKKSYADGVEDILLKPHEVSNVPFFVLLAYLFNPFTLLSCVGYSTSVFHSFYLAGMMFSLVFGLPMFAGLLLAICTCVSLYVGVLVIPLYLYFANSYKSVIKAMSCVVSFLFFTIIIMLVSTDYGKDFGYITNVYGCILTIPDLQPNIGLFWYFFTEMFDHFRDLFVYAFQINASLLYLVPLSIKFRRQPFLLIVAVLFIITIFKSYPSIGDVGFVFSLLPCFVHLFSYTQQSFLVGVILLISTSLAPVLWYLWIYCNSANANFYFGVTLAFAISQIFLLTDLLFAQVKREFILKHGNKREIDGEEAVLYLE